MRQEYVNVRLEGQEFEVKVGGGGVKVGGGG